MLALHIDSVGQDIGHNVGGEAIRAVDGQAAVHVVVVAPGDRIALLSENRPEWAITDFACLTARAELSTNCLAAASALSNLSIWICLS